LDILAEDFKVRTVVEQHGRSQLLAALQHRCGQIEQLTVQGLEPGLVTGPFASQPVRLCVLPV